MNSNKWVVVGHNTAVGEVCGVYAFDTEKEAREWVEGDIRQSTTEPFTKTGHPLWDEDDIDRSDPFCIKAADEFEWIITQPNGPKKRYGYVYIDEGDSCDGFPDASGRLWETEEQAREEMLRDAAEYGKRLSIPVKVNGNSCSVEGACSWRIVAFDTP